MLFFRSENHVNRWCELNNTPKRPIINLEQLWHLATIWYGNRLTVDSRRPGPSEMVGISAKIGLSGRFWDPQADHWR
jgi:hypothetical protein